MKVKWDPENETAFVDAKAALLAELFLFTVDPDAPFVLRVDASGRPLGASSEQLPSGSQSMEEDPLYEAALKGKTRPVGFLSRKFTASQAVNWDIRDK